MNRPGFIALFLVSVAPLAYAVAPRTFVASTGVDSNPCSLAAPCRSFGAAVAQTNPGGTVVVLDSAGYGAVTLGQSISIIAPSGIYAGVTASSGDAITIAGASATDVITLRGLSIEGAGGANGISLDSAPLGALHVEDCYINNFTTAGLSFKPSNAAKLVVRRTDVMGCGRGILQFGSAMAGVTPHATIDHCRAERNTVGFHMQQSIGEISDSVASGNSGAGFLAEFFYGKMVLDNCVSTFNGAGVEADYSGSAYLSNTVVTGNTYGLYTIDVISDSLYTRLADNTYQVKTNSVIMNTTDGNFTGLDIAQ
jgi:hypothetical protein